MVNFLAKHAKPMIQVEKYAHINKLVIWLDGQFLGNVAFDEVTQVPLIEFTWNTKPTFKISFEDFNGIVKAWNEMQDRRLDLGQMMQGIFQVDKNPKTTAPAAVSVTAAVITSKGIAASEQHTLYPT